MTKTSNLCAPPNSCPQTPSGLFHTPLSAPVLKSLAGLWNCVAAKVIGNRGVASLSLPARVQLKSRARWSGVLASPMLLKCEDGLAWMTRNGDPHDYLLWPGESISLDKGAHVIVSALGQGATIHLDEA